MSNALFLRFALVFIGFHLYFITLSAIDTNHLIESKDESLVVSFCIYSLLILFIDVIVLGVRAFIRFIKNKKAKKND